MSFVQNQLKKDSVNQIENQSKLRSISYGSENELSYEFVGSGSTNNSKDNIETDDDEDDETESYDEDDDDDELDNTYEAKSTKKFKTV